MKKKLTSKEKRAIKSRKLLKQEVGRLAFKASEGDVYAERQLEYKIKRDPVARDVLNEIVASKSLANYEPGLRDKIKLTKEEKDVLKSRKLYKMKIGHLAFKVSRGDSLAEAKLEQEMKRNPAANKILRNIIEKETLDCYEPNPEQVKIKSYGMPNYGNAFKPYSAGLPSLGRKS